MVFQYIKKVNYFVNMDGLALYRLNRIPEQQPTVKRKFSPPTVVPTNQSGTDFNCLRCGAHVTVTGDSVIQCQGCDYRIIQKKRKDVVVVKAV